MPDDDRPREPGTGNGDDDLDWSADVPATPARPGIGGSPVTLQGIGVPKVSADPAAPAATPATPAPAPATVTPASESPTEPPTAPDPIPPTVPTMPAVGDAAAGIRLEVFGRTDVGLVREHNEDNFLVADLSRQKRGVDAETRRQVLGAQGSLFAVCDGMGGAAAGEVASQMAVDTIHEWLQAGGVPRDHDALARRLVAAIEEAGRRIFNSAKADRTRRGMGTTVTAAALVDSTLFLAQVGDSRGYVVRQGKCGLVTRDQSLVNQLIEAGQLTEAEAESFEHSNIILQALGTAPEVQVDLTYVPLRRGDRLLLCSDGLSGLVPAEILREVLDGIADPEAACARLIEMANAGGGHDNITVVLVGFDGEGLPPPSPTEPPEFARYELPPAPEEPPAPAKGEGDAPPAATGGAESPYRGTKPENESDAGEAPAETPVRRASGGSGRWAIAILILLATGLAAYLFLSGDGLSAAVTSDQTALPMTAGGPAPGSTEPARDLRQRVVFLSSPGADLLIDGRPMARFDESGKAILNLDAGFYDVEVRDGAARIAGQRIDVRLDGENQFALHPPAVEGEEDTDPYKPPERDASAGASSEEGDRHRDRNRGEGSTGPTGQEGGRGSPIPENPFD